MGKVNSRKFSDIMTPEEVAQFLRCSQNKVYKMLEDGEIPGVKIAGGWRILKSNLLEMFKVNEESGGAKVTPLMQTNATTKEPIGAYVKKKICDLIMTGKLPTEELNNLTDPTYCKETLRANFPVIKIVDKSADLATQRKDSKGYSRYYKDVVADKYLLSSQWYDYQRQAFDSWYTTYK